MAIKLTDSRATVTAGRGRNKLVVLDVSFAELDKWAKKMKLNAPALFRKSYGRALRAIKNKLWNVMIMSGGVEGVPKFKDFEEFTKELRAAKGKYDPMGGVLTNNNHIVSYKENGVQIIGWPNSMAVWAVAFQDGAGGDIAEKFLTADWGRHNLHKLGIKDIPRQYVHNPRRVLPEPFGTTVYRHLHEWARGAFYKELARLMAKEAS